MPQSSIQLDEGTIDAIEQLKKVFNVKTNSGVIRKAIALSRIVARTKDADDTITVVDKKNDRTKISLGA